MLYVLITAILVAFELLYFVIAGKFNVIDRPIYRSSHKKAVTRGGGIIFMLSVWVWSVFYGFNYHYFIAALTLAAVMSFIDDIIFYLPVKVRLPGQFIAMFLLVWQLYELQGNAALTEIPVLMKVLFLIVLLVVFVGTVDIYNFMDGINGMTAGYCLAVLVPLLVLNREWQFVDETLIVVVILADLVFGFFNFRPNGKARCFAGDVGSIGIAYILLFMIGLIIMRTHDVTWLVLLVVYGVDGILTICHRIMLHEKLWVGHRKHAYQLMANELKMGHLKVSSFYMLLQLVISLVFIWVIPDTVRAHWIYLGAVVVVLSSGYVWFMKKYYHLHEEYLASLNENKN